MTNILEVSELALDAFESLHARNTLGELFPAEPVPGRVGTYFGLNHSGEFCLLLEVPTKFAKLDRRTDALHVEGVTRFRISGHDAEPYEAWFVVVVLNSGHERLLTSFAMMSAILLATLESPATNRDIVEFLDEFAALFAPTASVDRDLVLGLWGELYFLSRTVDTDVAAAAWHSAVDDRFDFSFDQLRVEVKTTLATDRRHHLSLAQVAPDPKVAYLASITATGDASGLSVRDLLGMCIDSVSKSRKQRVATLVLRALQGDLESADDYRFSLAGHSPLLFFDVRELPHPTIDDSRISDVRFVLNVAGLPDVPPPVELT